MSLQPMDEKESRKRRTRKRWPRKRKPRKKKATPRTKLTNKKTLVSTIARKIAQGIPLTSRERAVWEALSTLNEED